MPKPMHLAVLLALVFVHPAWAQPVQAAHHMAATANPLATDAARDILREHGSAIDAAIAAQMVLAVVEPQSSGLGGGTIILSWTARTRGLVFYEGLASAPAAVLQDYAHTPEGMLIPSARLDRSGRAVAVPGTLQALDLAHRAEGRLPWPRLFQAAIATAETGFPMPPYLHSVLQARRDLADKPGFTAYFASDKTPLPIGAILHNPALATTLRTVAAAGPAGLYSGPIADHIVAAVAQHPMPGALSLEDLAGYRARIRLPACIEAFAHRICSASPPVSGGVALLQQLAILDRLHIAEALPGRVQAAHLMLEASRLAEADRRRYIADPDQVAVPTAGLLDPAYLDGRAGLVHADAAMPTVGPGAPAGDHAGLGPSDPAAMPATTHISIVDDDGNAVSMTTTINLNFGSDIVVDGMVLNDAITNFATNPLVDGRPAANAAAAQRRPATTMAPTIVFNADGTPALILGAGGGARIVDAVAEVVIGMLAWHQDVRTAIAQPRIGAENRAEELERGTSAAQLAEPLRALGHTPRVVEMNAAVQAIAIGQGMTSVGANSLGANSLGANSLGANNLGAFTGWGDAHRDGVAAGD